MLAQQAEAGIGKRIAVSTASGEWPTPSVFEFVEKPRRLTYRITMGPGAPASGNVNIDCWRRSRDVSRETEWTAASSFQAGIPLTLRRPEQCSVSVDFYYDDFEQSGKVTVALFLKKRRHR